MVRNLCCQSFLIPHFVGPYFCFFGRTFSEDFVLRTFLFLSTFMLRDIFSNFYILACRSGLITGMPTGHSIVSGFPTHDHHTRFCINRYQNIIHCRSMRLKVFEGIF